MSLLPIPDQSIPDSKKDEEWHKLHPQAFASFSSSSIYKDERKNMLKYYRGYNAELSPEEMKLAKAITCPNGTDLGIEYIVYPLIQTKIEQIVGEYLLRPIRRKTYVVDKKSKNKKYNDKLAMLSEEIMRSYSKDVQPDLGFEAKTENPDMQLPEDVEEFFEKDFKTIAEDVADKLMDFFLDVRKEKNKFKELFIDYCVVDRAHGVIDKTKGHTSIRKVHPLDADYDIDPYKVVQDDHEYFFENYWLTENEVYNSYKLTPQKKAQVKKMFEDAGSVNSSSREDSESLSTTYKYDGWYQTTNKIGRIRLISAMWKSAKTVTFKKKKDKFTGEALLKKVKDKEIRDKDELEKIEGEMPRHCVMIGPEVCVSWGLMKQRFSTVEDPYGCILPVISIVRDNVTGTSQIKSVAAKLYQLQQLASEALFEIRLAFKHSGDSRVLLYDVAQTPKAFSKGSYNAGLNKVMHHVKKDKMMFFNSKDKGASKNGFNQFSSMDLSQKGVIQDLFNGLAVIEDLASKFVGISPEREGNVGQYQTANGTDAAIRGSAARTEVIYTPFDEFIQALLEKVLVKMRQDYPEGEVITYIFGEMKTKFIKLYKDFFEADLGLFLADSRKDKAAADRIDAAADRALGSAGNTPDMVMGLIEVFEGESASEKKAVFQRMVNSMEKIREAAEAAGAEQAKAEAAAKQAIIDTDILKSREGNDTEIQVANIYADSKSKSTNMKNDSDELQLAAELAKEEDEKKSDKGK